MRDHDLLERIARDAPAPRPGLADSVVAAARQRRRRAWTVAGASALAAAVAVSVPLTAELTRSSHPPGASDHSPGTTGPPAPPAPPTVIDPAAGVYLAALRYQRVLSAPQPGQLHLIRIRASNCDVGPEISGCPHQTPIPASIQRQVLAALPTGSNARFVAKPANNPPGSYSRKRVVVFVTFGAPQISGRHARVSVQTWRGFDLLAGSDLHLTEDGGSWRVTGLVHSYIT